jgi:hypothetical protein
MLSEVRNFPEIAEFYEREVIQPGELLLARTLQRGIKRGEFRPMSVNEVTLVLLAPMIFMALHKHSIGACTAHEQIDPDAVIATHIDLVLNGLAMRPAAELIRPPTPCTEPNP